jgi:hypothetical protein
MDKHKVEEAIKVLDGLRKYGTVEGALTPVGIEAVNTAIGVLNLYLSSDLFMGEFEILKIIREQLSKVDDAYAKNFEENLAHALSGKIPPKKILYVGKEGENILARI